VALLMEVKSPPEEWGKTSQPLIKQSSNQSWNNFGPCFSLLPR
jgi:hypothetical protein